MQWDAPTALLPGAATPPAAASSRHGLRQVPEEADERECTVVCAGAAPALCSAAAAAAAAHCRRRRCRLQVIVQDKWKDGARNTMESGGRKVRNSAVGRPVCLQGVTCCRCAASRARLADARPPACPPHAPAADQREQGAEQEEGVGALLGQVHGEAAGGRAADGCGRCCCRCCGWARGSVVEGALLPLLVLAPVLIVPTLLRLWPLAELQVERSEGLQMVPGAQGCRAGRGESGDCLGRHRLAPECCMSPACHLAAACLPAGMRLPERHLRHVSVPGTVTGGQQCRGRAPAAEHRRSARSRRAPALTPLSTCSPPLFTHRRRCGKQILDTKGYKQSAT